MHSIDGNLKGRSRMNFISLLGSTIQKRRGRWPIFEPNKLKSHVIILPLMIRTPTRPWATVAFTVLDNNFLTPIKIPGIDEDYEYMFPEGPHSYLSEEHRDTEAFRYPHKPRANDLLKMIHNFWPKEAKRKGAKMNAVKELLSYKNRLVEIDFAAIACKYLLPVLFYVYLNMSSQFSFLPLAIISCHCSSSSTRHLAFARMHPVS